MTKPKIYYAIVEDVKNAGDDADYQKQVDVIGEVIEKHFDSIIEDNGDLFEALRKKNAEEDSDKMAQAMRKLNAHWAFMPEAELVKRFPILKSATYPKAASIEEYYFMMTGKQYDKEVDAGVKSSEMRLGMEKQIVEACKVKDWERVAFIWMLSRTQTRLWQIADFALYLSALKPENSYVENFVTESPEAIARNLVDFWEKYKDRMQINRDAIFEKKQAALILSGLPETLSEDEINYISKNLLINPVIVAERLLEKDEKIHAIVPEDLRTAIRAGLNSYVFILMHQKEIPIGLLEYEKNLTPAQKSVAAGLGTTLYFCDDFLVKQDHYKITIAILKLLRNIL